MNPAPLHSFQQALSPRAPVIQRLVMSKFAEAGTKYYTDKDPNSLFDTAEQAQNHERRVLAALTIQSAYRGRQVRVALEHEATRRMDEMFTNPSSGIPALLAEYVPPSRPSSPV
ncbi:MAG: hypothetical protein ABI158_06180, partial [Edaphobacter sp.]